jgi:hypothetical protein
MFELLNYSEVQSSIIDLGEEVFEDCDVFINVIVLHVAFLELLMSFLQGGCRCKF